MTMSLFLGWDLTFVTYSSRKNTCALTPELQRFQSISVRASRFSKHGEIRDGVCKGPEATRSQNDRGVSNDTDRTGDESLVRRRELERKEPIRRPASSRLPNRKRSEENTNSPRILRAVSRFADARKKFVTKATRVRTWRDPFVIEKKKEGKEKRKEKQCRVARRLSFSVEESSTISILHRKCRGVREEENRRARLTRHR